ncbi:MULTISPECIES: hypothetical protein [Streptomyces]|uniref:hypothetical protein n=1 Tax=Streptomyces TaxID=1883 RepID=UPI002248BDC1|nr:hypothetical protein [Streptomyces sp. JHD 1]MCX2967456.1 hypothetical protein [Streptomyces sp. JHD 1]
MRHRKKYTLTLFALFFVITTGCSLETSGESMTEQRAQSAVNSEIKGVSSGILDIIAVDGEVSEPGPGVGRCEEGELRTHFLMRHTWSLTARNSEVLAESMERLKAELPKQGWEILSYGPNNSPARTLTLMADHPEKKYGISIEYWRTRASDDAPMLLVGVVSACYRVPPGETVERY